MNTLLGEIENLTPPAGTVACWGLGGMGFALKGSNTLIYVDLFLDPAYQDEWVSRAIPPPFSAADVGYADLVLVSHEHPDHTDLVALRALAAQTSSVIAGPEISCDLAIDAGFPSERIRLLESGKGLQSGEASVNAFSSGDVLAKSPLIYVIELEGYRMLHAGDSLLTKTFDAIGDAGGVDVAFLATCRNPPGQKWYMQPGDVVEAARRLRCQLLVPSHWDLWQDLTWSPEGLMTELRGLAPDIPVVLLPIGTHLLLSRSQLNGQVMWSVAGSVVNKPRAV